MNTNEKKSLKQVVSNLLIETKESSRKKMWYELVHNTHEKLIKFLCKRFSKLSIHQIELLVNDTYLKINEEILKKRTKKQTVFLDKNEQEVEDIFSYLYRIATNKTIQFLKKETKTQILNENQGSNQETEIIFEEENKLLALEYKSKYLAISAIDPHSQREVFYTFIQFEFGQEKYSYLDIAKILNISSANAVTQRIKEAKKKYIELLKKYKNRVEQTENFTLERIEKKIRQKLAQNAVLDFSKTEHKEELEVLIWQIILLTKDDNFEKYCKFFLLDSISENSNKENNTDFSELNYIFNHWTENKIAYELLINPKLNPS